MKLAIADPPYLGRAAVYAPGGTSWHGDFKRHRPRRTTPRGDNNPAAYEWDDPETHRKLIRRLRREYDGWAR